MSKRRGRAAALLLLLLGAPTALAAVGLNSEPASNIYYESTTVPVSSYPVTFACQFFPISSSLNFGSMITISESSTQDNLAAISYLFATDQVQGAWKRAGTSNDMTPSNTGSASVWQHCTVKQVADNDGTGWFQGDIANKATASLDIGGFPSSLDVVSIGVSNLNINFNYYVGSVANFGAWTADLSDDEVRGLAVGAHTPYVRPGSLVTWVILDEALATVDDRVGGAAYTAFGNPTTESVLPFGPRPGAQQ